MNSIPSFPNSQPIHIELASEMKRIIGSNPPYSDFDLVNLLSWDLDNQGKVSLLNDNLVVQLADYVTGNEFYSYYGTKEPEDTATTLLNAAECSSGDRILRLIPEISALALTGVDRFVVTEDPNSHDYVISMQQIISRSGKKFTHLRRSINIFQSLYETDTEFVELDLSDSRVQGKMIEVFLAREQEKNENDHDNELIAMSRLFNYADDFLLRGYGLEIGNQLRAFIIVELLDGEWSLGHFWKADTTYKGIYSYLICRTAGVMDQQGILRMNIQQDLGIEGLRRMKQFLLPEGKLSKYTVEDLPKD